MIFCVKSFLYSISHGFKRDSCGQPGVIAISFELLQYRQLSRNNVLVLYVIFFCSYQFLAVSAEGCFWLKRQSLWFNRNSTIAAQAILSLLNTL